MAMPYKINIKKTGRAVSLDQHLLRIKLTNCLGHFYYEIISLQRHIELSLKEKHNLLPPYYNISKITSFELVTYTLKHLITERVILE